MVPALCAVMFSIQAFDWPWANCPKLHRRGTRGQPSQAHFGVGRLGAPGGAVEGIGEGIGEGRKGVVVEFNLALTRWIANQRGWALW